LLAESIAERVEASIELGKEFTVTLHPRTGNSLQQLKDHVDIALGQLGVEAIVRTSASAVDISPPGIDKASGLRWISSLYGTDLSQVAAIGDSDGDIPMLEVAGHSGAPSNAEESVSTRVAYRSSRSNVWGVIDYFMHLAKENAGG
jgi:HAD superfamily hydrolase (TIGR01484 family)